MIKSNHSEYPAASLNLDQTENYRVNFIRNHYSHFGVFGRQSYRWQLYIGWLRSATFQFDKHFSILTSTTFRWPFCTLGEPFISQVGHCYLLIISLPRFRSDQVSNMEMIDYRACMDYGATQIYMKYCHGSSSLYSHILVITYFKCIWLGKG